MDSVPEPGHDVLSQCFEMQGAFDIETKPSSSS